MSGSGAEGGGGGGWEQPKKQNQPRALTENLGSGSRQRQSAPTFGRHGIGQREHAFAGAQHAAGRALLFHAQECNQDWFSAASVFVYIKGLPAKSQKHWLSGNTLKNATKQDAGTGVFALRCETERVKW